MTVNQTHQGPAVLLIDDAPLILDLLTEILEESGYRVLSTETGQDIASILDQEQVAVVFCDVFLPGTNGVDVLRQIKQQAPEVQVIMISGQQDFDIARQVLRERALDFLVKPFGAGEVLSAVQQGVIAYEDALTQKKVHSEAQRRMADLVLLKQIGETASAGSDLQELFELILDSITQSTGVETASLMIPSEDNMLRITAACGLSKQIIDSVVVAPGEGISGHVFQSHEPVLIQDAKFDDRFRSLVAGDRYKTQSLLSVPILYRDQALGVINVNNKSSGKSFDFEDQNLLMAIAHQAALAIENFKLVASLRQQTQTLERINADLVKFNLARTRLVCNLSHELKTPLTSIMGFLDLALTFYQKLSEEDLKDYLGQAHEEGVHLDRLLSGMLRLFSLESERDPWKLKAFNIGWAISDAFQCHGDQIASKKLLVDVAVDEDLPEIYGDPEKFSIALGALLDNAVKFNREDGHIRVNAQKKLIDGLEFVYLQIQNDGQSIPPAARARIFDSYTQLGNIDTEKPHGVGIGLTLVKVVLDKMEAQVCLEDKTDGGASFGLLLPSEKSYATLSG